MDSERMINTFDADKVKKLEVETVCADVFFEPSSDGEIRVEAENLWDGIYTCELKGERLEVSYEHPRKAVSFRNNIDTRIILFLPANLALEQIELENGAGNVKSANVPISCKEMEVEIGAGKWKAEGISVSGRLYIKVGAGNVKIKNIKSGELDIECGVGNCIFEGRVDGNMKVECGVGNCKLKLENKESDFNYDISCALGKVSVNGTRIKNLGSERLHRDGTALAKAVLECGLGNISVETA